MAKDNTPDKPIKPIDNRRPNGTFGPGNNANPKGRPVGQTLTEQMRQMLESRPEIREALIQKTIAKALEGDPAFTKLLWSYLDGMPKQNVDVTTLGDKIQQSVIHYLPERNGSIISPDKKTGISPPTKGE